MNFFKNAEEVHETGLTHIKYVVDTAREPFLILDKDLRVISANDSFYRFFCTASVETEGKMVYDLGNKQWNNSHLKKLLEDILPKQTFFKDFELAHDFPIIGKKVLMMNARIVFCEKDPEKTPVIILAMEDVTKQKLVEERLREYTEELERRVTERTSDLEARLSLNSKALENRVKELERLNEAMIGRENKMVELKEQILVLEEKLEKALSQLGQKKI